MEIEIAYKADLQRESYPHFETSVKRTQGEDVLILKNDDDEISLDKSELLDLIEFAKQVGFIDGDRKDN